MKDRGISAIASTSALLRLRMPILYDGVKKSKDFA